MSRRRAGNQVLSFLDAFNSAYSTTRGVMKDREIQKISEATPEQSEGFTAEQGDQLRAAAESGQYDITYDDQAKAYKVAPKADPTQVGTIAQQGVTDFLGQRTTGTMDETKVGRARQMAMGGVLKKYGDVAGGLRLEADARAGERDDLRFGREQKRWEQEDATAAREEELRTIEAGVGEWAKKRLTNPDGTQREATMDDQLELGQYHATQLMQAGRVKEASALAKQNQEMAMSKIQVETAERNDALGKVAASVAAGDLSTAGQFYDRYIPDGARVKGIVEDPKTGQISIEREMNDGGSAPPRTFKNREEFLAALNQLKDPTSLYNFSQNEFRNMLALRADNRGSAAEARAAAANQRNQDEEKQRRDAAVALFKERNPNATPAQIEAVKTGVLPAIGTDDKNAPAEVKLANAFVAAGLAPDLAEGLRMATQSKTDSPAKVRQEIYAKALQANFGDAAAAAKATDEAMKYLGIPADGGGAKNGTKGEEGGDIPTPKSKDELAKLKPGTRYRAPDGSIRTRQ